MVIFRASRISSAKRRSTPSVFCITSLFQNLITRIAVRLDQLATRLVAVALGVLAAVKFDRKLQPAAGEIDN